MRFVLGRVQPAVGVTLVTGFADRHLESREPPASPTARLEAEGREMLEPLGQQVIDSYGAKRCSIAQTATPARLLIPALP